MAPIPDHGLPEHMRHRPTPDMVEWRNFRLTGVQTEQFNQTIRMVTDGEAEEMHHLFHITVTALVHIDDFHFANVHVPEIEQSYAGPYVSGYFKDMPAATKIIYIQEQMMHPRGAFRYYSGGTLILTADSIAESPYRDVNNGPKPLSCDILDNYNGQVFRIRFSIEIALVKCGGLKEGTVRSADFDPWQPMPGNDDPRLDTRTKCTADGRCHDPAYGALEADNVLSHTWSLSETKNRDFYSTRSLSGSLRVAHLDYWPHIMRYLVVPPLAGGYQRVRQNFVQTTDKLALQYTVEDEQKYAAPPRPAVDWECTQSHRMSPFGDTAFMNLVELRIRLVGAPGTVKHELIKTCLDIITARVGNIRQDWTGSPGDKTKVYARPTNMVLVDHLHAHTIEMAIAVEICPIDETSFEWAQLFNIWLGPQGYPLGPSTDENSNLHGYNQAVWPQPNLYDARQPVGVFAAYIQSPCNDIHGVTQPVYLNNIDPQTGEWIEGAWPDTYGVRPMQGNWPAEFWETSKELQPTDYDGKKGSDIAGNSEQPTGTNKYPMTRVEIDSEHDTDDGLITLPKADTQAATGATTESFSLHRGIETVTYIVSAERRGDWPQLPKFNPTQDDPNGITERLVSHKLIPEAPRLDVDGRTQIYTAHAKLVYALDTPVAIDGTLRGTGSMGIKSNQGSTEQPSEDREVQGRYDLAAYLTDNILGGNIT